MELNRRQFVNLATGSVATCLLGGIVPTVGNSDPPIKAIAFDGFMHFSAVCAGGEFCVTDSLGRQQTPCSDGGQVFVLVHSRASNACHSISESVEIAPFWIAQFRKPGGASLIPNMLASLSPRSSAISCCENPSCAWLLVQDSPSHRSFAEI